MFRFYAVPSWQLAEKDAKAGAPPAEPPLRPAAPDAPIDQVLARAEYRGAFAVERGKQLLEQAKAPAIYAQPPNDLPALLRTADQLLAIARQEAGERVHAWRCECGARYTMTAGLWRPLTLRCERCGRNVELDPQRAVGEPRQVDPERAKLNEARQALADFFREAMARGWPVLVEKA